MRPRRSAEGRRPTGLPFSRSPHYLGIMAWENLTDEERAELLRELRGVIAADPYPLSPRIRRLKATMAKLDPDSVPAPRPAPKPVAPRKPYVPSMLAQRKKARRR